MKTPEGTFDFTGSCVACCAMLIAIICVMGFAVLVFYSVMMVVK